MIMRIMVRIKLAFLLVIPVSPIIDATLTSIIEIAEVSAAEKSKAKNAIEKKLPYGINSKAFGRVVNASSAPAVGCSPKVNTREKIAVPASRAAAMSDMVMINADFVMSVSSGI